MTQSTSEGRAQGGFSFTLVLVDRHAVNRRLGFWGPEVLPRGDLRLRERRQVARTARSSLCPSATSGARAAHGERFYHRMLLDRFLRAWLGRDQGLRADTALGTSAVQAPRLTRREAANASGGIGRRFCAHRLEERVKILVLFKGRRGQGC